MPFDLVAYRRPTAKFGNDAVAPALPPITNMVNVANDVNSATITIPQSGGYITVTGSGALLRFAVLQANPVDNTFSGNPDPATSAIVLPVGVPQTFYLEPGSYRARATAWV